MVDYRSAGTVEYLYDGNDGKWYFLGELSKLECKSRSFLEEFMDLNIHPKQNL